MGLQNDQLGEFMVTNRYRSFRYSVALAVLIFSMVAACTKHGSSGTASKSVAVPIHGVNYTAEAFAFVVRDPLNRENYGGGEEINPYGAGGTRCCYSLPAKWRPGLKVEISETYWLPRRPDNSLPEFKKRHIVEIPAYQGSEVGELWVLRMPDGEIAVVSSDVQPDHPDWSGKIKGWPIPSLEYQRKLHDQAIAEAESTVKLYVGLNADMAKDPNKRAQEAWNSDERLRPSRLKAYRGARDPAYQAMLREHYSSELKIVRDELAKIRAARP
jgi:hypothetical protein